ncbi:MAG: type III secretion system stator protein SctL [Betaproteobacteria bacterium]|jgi:type III secretion system HrpE/YscL family protein
MSLLLLKAESHAALIASDAVIRRDVFRQLHDIDCLLREAQASAQEMVHRAREEADALRAAAYEDGLLRGHEAAVVAVLSTLDVERRMMDLLADRIGKVVEQCIRSLIGQVAAAELYQSRIRHAVSTLVPEGQATLHVAPGQAHVAQEALARLVERTGADLRWIAIRVDERCPVDEFVIETQVGFVDARLSTTIDDARRIIEQAIRRAADRLPLGR